MSSHVSHLKFGEVDGTIATAYVEMASSRRSPEIKYHMAASGPRNAAWTELVPIAAVAVLAFSILPTEYTVYSVGLFLQTVRRRESFISENAAAGAVHLSIVAMFLLIPAYL
jgi:hypothetical protein